jgi:hypothetical protein
MIFDKILNLTEITESLYVRYQRQYREIPMHQAISRVIEDLRSDFFNEDPIYRFVICMELISRNQGDLDLIKHLSAYFNKNSIEQVKIIIENIQKEKTDFKLNKIMNVTFRQIEQQIINN